MSFSEPDRKKITIIKSTIHKFLSALSSPHGSRRLLPSSAASVVSRGPCLCRALSFTVDHRQSRGALPPQSSSAEWNEGDTERTRSKRLTAFQTFTELISISISSGIRLDSLPSLPSTSSQGCASLLNGPSPGFLHAPLQLLRRLRYGERSEGNERLEAERQELYHRNRGPFLGPE